MSPFESYLDPRCMVGENVCVLCTHFIEIKTNYKYIFPVNLSLDPIALQFCVGVFDFVLVLRLAWLILALVDACLDVCLLEVPVYGWKDLPVYL